MSHAAVRIHERGSFGSTFASALMITNPTMNSRRNRSIDWPSNETVACHLPKVPVKLISPQKSLSKAEPQGGKDRTCCMTYYLELVSII